MSEHRPATDAEVAEIKERFSTFDPAHATVIKLGYVTEFSTVLSLIARIRSDAALIQAYETYVNTPPSEPKAHSDAFLALQEAKKAHERMVGA